MGHPVAWEAGSSARSVVALRQGGELTGVHFILTFCNSHTHLLVFIPSITY